MTEPLQKKHSAASAGEDGSAVDVSYEPDADSDNAKDPEATLRKLKEKLKRCETERAEYLDGWQRMKADLVNAKKALDEEKGRFVRFSQEGIIRELLPAIDSFHIAFGNKEAWEKVDLNWRLGIQHIYSQFITALERHGVKLLNPIGEMFNPKEHSAAGSVAVSEKKDDHRVMEVVQKGYSLHGKLMQPAKVKIGEYGGS